MVDGGAAQTLEIGRSDSSSSSSCSSGTDASKKKQEITNNAARRDANADRARQDNAG